jgi:hypothetical protein
VKTEEAAFALMGRLASRRDRSANAARSRLIAFNMAIEAARIGEKDEIREFKL